MIVRITYLVKIIILGPSFFMHSSATVISFPLSCGYISLRCSPTPLCADRECIPIIIRFASSSLWHSSNFIRATWMPNQSSTLQLYWRQATKLFFIGSPLISPWRKRPHSTWNQHQWFCSAPKLQSSVGFFLSLGFCHASIEESESAGFQPICIYYVADLGQQANFGNLPSCTPIRHFPTWW